MSDFYYYRKSHAESGSRLLTSFSESSSVADRLKPPPSCIDFNKKTIKIGSTSSSKAQKISEKLTKSPPASSDSGKNSINSVKEEGSIVKTGKKKITPITFSSSSPLCAKSPSPTKDSGLDMKKTINLINKHLNVDGKKNEESSKAESNNAESNDVTEQAKMVCIIIKIYTGTFIIQKCSDYNNPQSPEFES